MNPDEVCPAIATHDANLAATIEGIANAYGSAPVFRWRPTIATTRKTRGPCETAVDGSLSDCNETIRRCTELPDSFMADRAGITYFPLHDTIDRDTVDVCLDHYGHVTLEGNRRIALRIPGIIEPLMADPRPWDTRVELRVINPE